jgi:hypothetical protein
MSKFIVFWFKEAGDWIGFAFFVWLWHVFGWPLTVANIFVWCILPCLAIAILLSLFCMIRYWTTGQEW